MVTSRASRVVEVWVSSESVRPHDGGLITTESDQIPVVDGQVEFTLEEGVAMMTLVTAGGGPAEQVALFVPDATSASLADCVRNAELAGDRDVGELAGILEQIRGSVGESAEARAGAEAAAGAAEASAGAAAGAESRASGHEDEARRQAGQAGSHAAQAGAHAEAAGRDATRAEDAAVDAAGSAEAAGESEIAAGGHAVDAESASGVALEAADRVGSAEQVETWHGDALAARDEAVSAADQAASEADRAEAAADTAVTGVPDGAVTRPKLAPAVRDELDAKADQDHVDEMIAPRDLHGTLIVDPIVLAPSGVTIMFPRPTAGEVTVRVDYSSVVTGNSLALIGFMFRGPDGEKAVDGMSDLPYSTGVGEPYMYMPVSAGDRTVWSHTVTPDEGWTLDGIIIRSWRSGGEDGAGNITVHAFAVDDGSTPSVVTRDFYGGIAVPDVPVSPSSATSREFVTREVAKKADVEHTHVSAEITDATTSTGRPEHARRLVRTDIDGYIYSYNDPTHIAQVARKGYVDQEVGKKADASHSHTAAQVGAATPAYVDERIQLVTAWPSSPTPGVLYLMEEE